MTIDVAQRLRARLAMSVSTGTGTRGAFPCAVLRGNGKVIGSGDRVMSIVIESEYAWGRWNCIRLAAAGAIEQEELCKNGRLVRFRVSEHGG